MADTVYAVFKTNHGDFTVELFPDKAPITVANFRKLAESGFYDGTIFHRIIPQFMIQGGDPEGTGYGGSDEMIPDEFDPSLTFAEPGVLAMANAGPNTGSSQFFVTVVPTPWLDGKHAIFGQVKEGMEVVFVPPVLTEPKSAVVEEASFIKDDAWFVRFEGVTSKDAAEQLVGRYCLVRKADLRGVCLRDSSAHSRGLRLGALHGTDAAHVLR